MRPALLRRAAANDVRSARHIRKPCPDFLPANDALPGRPPWPCVFLARRQWRRGALPRGGRSKPAARAVPHCVLCARLAPFCVLRGCGPHSRAAPRRPTMPVPRAQVANRSPDALPANALSPGRRLWPHVFLSRRQRHRGSLPGAPVPISALCAHRFGPAACNDAFRRAATSNDARAACRLHKLLSLFSAGKRFAARPSVVAPRLSCPWPAASRGDAARATL